MKAKCKCGAVYQLSAKFAGKKVKCKKCENVFAVPAAAAVPAAPKPIQEAEVDLLSGDLSNVGVPVQRKKKVDHAAKRRREKEDALLAKYEGKRSNSTEDFIANNIVDSMEEERHDAAVYSIFYGLGLIVLAVVLYWVLGRYSDEVYVPRIVWILLVIGGEFWMPLVTFLFGCLLMVSGILGVIRVSKHRKSRGV